MGLLDSAEIQSVDDAVRPGPDPQVGRQPGRVGNQPGRVGNQQSPVRDRTGRIGAGCVSRAVGSPIGDLTVAVADGKVVRLLLPTETPVEDSAAGGAGTGEGLARSSGSAEGSAADRELLDRAATQLDEYFAGRRWRFDLPLSLDGTVFQRAVWAALRQIPYGQTASYGDIAARVGNPKAVRAVGGANNRNPVAIIVPCHRVIGHGGSLVGYGGGLDTKRWLLDHERLYAWTPGLLG